MRKWFLLMIPFYFFSLSSYAEEMLHLKNGSIIRARVEMITHKIVSIRVIVDLGNGKQGEVKRSISLKSIEFIEFGALNNEVSLLEKPDTADLIPLRKLWDGKLPYLGQARSNAGEVGLILADTLLRTDSIYHWNDAIALYDLISKKSWRTEDRRSARIGRVRGLIIRGNLDEAKLLAHQETSKNESETVIIDAHFLLGEIALQRLKQLYVNHPKWDEDEVIKPLRDGFYHNALDHYLKPALFYGAHEESAARGLMAAYQVYHFVGEVEQARECLEDIIQIYPNVSIAKQAAEKIKFYDEKRTQIPD